MFGQNPPFLFQLLSQEEGVGDSDDKNNHRTNHVVLLGDGDASARAVRHTWAPGDVVVWDNACVLHRADHADVVGDRVMHRGMVTGYRAA